MAIEIPESFNDLISAVVKTAMDDGAAMMSDFPNKRAQREAMKDAMEARVALHSAVSNLMQENESLRKTIDGLRSGELFAHY